MYTVYNYLNEIMYQGTFQNCEQWIFARAERINDKVYYRTWREKDYTYYDVGEVYHINNIKGFEK